LTALLGRLPSQEPPETFRLDALTLPADLPVSLPSKLVEQRPDVRQAEENLHAASAAVGVALANMLPQFAINAIWGRAH
jgi:outer membrane protein TolC